MLSAIQTPHLLADFDGHMDWDGGWGVVMMIGMVVFWALVIVAAVWLVRDLARGRSSPQAETEQPLEVLDRRLAEGAISVEEYQERRALLNRSP
jgi:putative membrane protein